jgi:hypothetical protein
MAISDAVRFGEPSLATSIDGMGPASTGVIPPFRRSAASVAPG